MKTIQTIHSSAGRLVLLLMAGLVWAGTVDARPSERRILRQFSGTYKGRLVNCTAKHFFANQQDNLPNSSALIRVPPLTGKKNWTVTKPGWDTIMGWPAKVPTWGKFSKPKVLKRGKKVKYRGEMAFVVDTPPSKGPFSLTVVKRGRSYIMDGKLKSLPAGANDYQVKAQVKAKK